MSKMEVLEAYLPTLTYIIWIAVGVMAIVAVCTTWYAPRQRVHRISMSALALVAVWPAAVWTKYGYYSPQLSERVQQWAIGHLWLLVLVVVGAYVISRLLARSEDF